MGNVIYFINICGHIFDNEVYIFSSWGFGYEVFRTMFLSYVAKVGTGVLWLFGDPLVYTTGDLFLVMKQFKIHPYL